MSPQLIADYRAQGRTLGPAATIVEAQGRAAAPTRWSTERWGLRPRERPLSSSSSGTGYSDMPELEPMQSTEPRGHVNGESRISRLEQYLVAVVDGERMFFRVSIWIEPGYHAPPRPCVLVDHMDDVLFGGNGAYDTDTWFLFGVRVEDAIREELSRALNEAFQQREERSRARRVDAGV